MRNYYERTEDRPRQDAVEPKNRLRRTAISGIALSAGMLVVITGVGANVKGLKANQDTVEPSIAKNAIDSAPNTNQPLVVTSCPPGGRAMTLGAGIIAETYGTEGIGIDVIVVGDGAKTPVVVYGNPKYPNAWCGPLSDKLNYKTNTYTPDPRHLGTVNMLIPGWNEVCGIKQPEPANGDVAPGAVDCDLRPQVFRNLGPLLVGSKTA
jgi:hypothetical protein